MALTILAPLRAVKLSLAVALFAALSACGSMTSQTPKEMNFASAAPVSKNIDPQRKALAIALAKDMRERGQRVWCVPFARNYSGLNLRGNAATWWNSAKGVYQRGHEPKIGAVMTFSATRHNPRGHVAVVSSIVNDREILIDHANWKRNQVSLGMKVIDVSDKNDWSKVRVMSQKNASGRVFPISGFIYQNHAKG